MANFIDQANTTQHISGSDDHDVFIIDGKSTDFGWGPTQDGEGIVIWSDTGFDVLHDVEEIQFSDFRLVRDENGVYQRTDLSAASEASNNSSSNTLSDDSSIETSEALTTKIAGVTQYVQGTSERDVFVIEKDADGFGWGPTEDGQGLVIWNGADFDIVYNVEEVRFNNLTLTLNQDGSYSATETSSEATTSVSDTSTSETAHTEETSSQSDDTQETGSDTQPMDDAAAPNIDGDASSENDQSNEASEDKLADGNSASENDSQSTDNSSDTEPAQDESAIEEPSDAGTDQSETDTKRADDTAATDTDNTTSSAPDQTSEDDTTENNSSSNDATASTEESSPEEPASDTTVSEESSKEQTLSDLTPDQVETTQQDQTSEVETQTPDDTEEPSDQEPTVPEYVYVPQARITGATKQLEGNTYSYNVELDEPVEVDTWVTVRVNSGTAYQDDGSTLFFRFPKDSGISGKTTESQDAPIKAQWGFDSEERLSVYAVDAAEIYFDNLYSGPSGVANAWSSWLGNRPNEEGGGRWSFEEFREFTTITYGVENLKHDYTLAQDGVLLRGEENELRVLVKAGETTSSSFEILANKELNNGYNSFNSYATESDENFSIEVTQIGETTLQEGPELEVVICDHNGNISPVAIDLNGDGAIGVTGETSSRDKQGVESIGQTVEFDIDADGNLDTIEWFDGSGDGILIDNRDGKAANDMDGSRIFGDEGGRYNNGYEKLALLDSNEDGTLTFEELEGLELWVDDGDAIVEDGELQSLADHGIVEISVISEDVLDDEGRTLIQSRAFTEDGSELLTEDVWFARANSDLSELLDWSAETAEIEEPQSFDMEIRFLEADHMMG